MKEVINTATQMCWKCGKQFEVLEDEVGMHGCPNRLCANYDKLDIDLVEEDESEEN